MKQKYFICNHCGNIVTMIKDMGVPISCCGEEMKEMLDELGYRQIELKEDSWGNTRMIKAKR